MNYQVTCPGCCDQMDACLVTCWACYRELNGRNGYPTINPADVASWDRARAQRIGKVSA